MLCTQGHESTAWVVASYTRKLPAEADTVLAAAAHHARVNLRGSPMLGR